MAATVPTMAMGRSTLCVMSLSPEFGSIYTTYQNHSGVATPANTRVLLELLADEEAKQMDRRLADRRRGVSLKRRQK
jgi:hypothetical protein